MSGVIIKGFLNDLVLICAWHPEVMLHCIHICAVQAASQGKS